MTISVSRNARFRVFRGEKKEKFYNHGGHGNRLAWSSPDTEGLGKLPSDKLTTKIPQNFLVFISAFGMGSQGGTPEIKSSKCIADN